MFFQDLNGGIHAFPKEKLHKQAKDNDLWILGEFRHHLESLGGERDLEIEDKVFLEKYRIRKQTKERKIPPIIY